MRWKLPRTKARLRREAARWLARLEGGSEPGVERSFRVWYETDAAHSAAFDRVSRHYAQAGLLRHSHAHGKSVAENPPHTRVRKSRYALAAVIALFLLVPAGLMLLRQQGRTPFGETYALLLATSIGEIKQVTLADGSKITLDADSVVRVELRRTERRAILKRGRARFAVAHDPRPFTLEAGAARVSTTQAIVDADLGDEQSRIEVLSGTAQVDTRPEGKGPALRTLAQGQGLTATPDGAVTYAVQAGGTGWPNGMLQFNATPLSSVAAEANRYSSQKLLVADSLGGLRVSGAFRAGDIAGLARSLAAAFRLHLDRTPDGNLLLSRAPARAPEKKKGG